MNDLKNKSQSILNKLNGDIGTINSRKMGDSEISLSRVIDDDGEIFVNVDTALNSDSSLTLIFVATNNETEECNRDDAISHFFNTFDDKLLQKLIKDNADSVAFAQRLNQNIFAAYSIDENLFLGNGIIEKTDVVKQ